MSEVTRSTKPEDALKIGPLVAERQATIAQHLDMHFAQFTSPEALMLNEVADLLDTPALPLAAALYFVRSDEVYRISAVGDNIKRPPSYTTSKKNKFAPSELYELNKRPELHTKSLEQIVGILDVSRMMVAAVVREKGIKPLFCTNYHTDHIKFEVKSLSLGGFYNLDQIATIGEAVQRFNAPKNLIGQTNILHVTGISPAAFNDMCGRLEIKGSMYRNPQVGHQEYHFKETEVIALLRFIKDNKDRRGR